MPERPASARLAVGERVVRGPDWRWGRQDGGPGSPGTVVEIDVPAAGADAGDGTGIVRVRWDHGHVDVYCDGARGLHDVARRVPPAVCTEAAPAVRVEDSEPSE